MYAMEYYLPVKNEAGDPCFIENAMLSEKSQSQRTTYCVIPFIQNTQKGQIYRDKKWISSCLELWEC